MKETDLKGKPASSRVCLGHTEGQRERLRGRMKWEICGLSGAGLYGNFEEALDVGLDVDGREGAAVASEGLPLRPNEELLKVPGHI